MAAPADVRWRCPVCGDERQLPALLYLDQPPLCLVCLLTVPAAATPVFLERSVAALADQ